jgi:hypothetical protein
MEQRPIAQGTGSGNNVISVYSDRVELSSGLGSQNASVGLKQVASVSIRGWVNCTLTIEINDGRRLNVQRMALPDARQIKAVIERQKRMAGLYE